MKSGAHKPTQYFSIRKSKFRTFFYHFVTPQIVAGAVARIENVRNSHNSAVCEYQQIVAWSLDAVFSVCEYDLQKGDDYLDEKNNKKHHEKKPWKRHIRSIVSTALIY